MVYYNILTSGIQVKASRKVYMDNGYIRIMNIEWQTWNALKTDKLVPLSAIGTHHYINWIAPN